MSVFSKNQNERGYDGEQCTCTEACFESEEESGDRCGGWFANDPCGCRACGDLCADIYADGQYQ